MQSTYKQATDYIEGEIDKVIKKPQEDVQKTREDVREKVCEDWLKE